MKSAVSDKLKGINNKTVVKAFISEIAEEILRQFEPVTLLDKYDVYQVLLAYWQDVMADDAFIIKADGYKAARETENIVKVTEKKKKDGSKVTTEKVVGWEGKLIGRLFATIISVPNNRQSPTLRTLSSLRKMNLLKSLKVPKKAR